MLHNGDGVDHMCGLLRQAVEDEQSAKSEYGDLIDAAGDAGKDDVVDVVKGIRRDEMRHNDMFEQLREKHCMSRNEAKAARDEQRAMEDIDVIQTERGRGR